MASYDADIMVFLHLIEKTKNKSYKHIGRNIGEHLPNKDINLAVHWTAALRISLNKHEFVNTGTNEENKRLQGNNVCNILSTDTNSICSEDVVCLFTWSACVHRPDNRPN